ncbi:MAG: hypothetical protein WCQ99_00935 [Pseudomonadota bacterium]
MKNKKKNKTNRSGFLLVCLMVFMCAVWCSQCFAQEDQASERNALAGDNSTKPLVVYYSRTGNARMVATALKTQLACDMAEIESKKNKGVFTIMTEQWFGMGDKQKPLALDPKSYNPIIIVSPIYFMRLSQPARTFISKTDLKGKDAYIFTTSGGPLAGFSGNWIREIATEHELQVKGVTGLQISKKNTEGKGVPKSQEDFDNDVKAILEKTPIIGTSRQ